MTLAQVPSEVVEVLVAQDEVEIDTHALVEGELQYSLPIKFKLTIS